MDYKVVPIAEEHIESYHATLDRVAREKKYLAFYEAPPMDKTAAWVRGNIASDLPQFVAVSGGTVVGWCDIEGEGGRLSKRHIGEVGIGLLPEFRGQGIGQALMLATIEKARAKGMTRIMLEVLSTNAGAIALYKKLGFEREGLLKKAHRFEDGSFGDAVIMARVY